MYENTAPLWGEPGECWSILGHLSGCRQSIEGCLEKLVLYDRFCLGLTGDVLGIVHRLSSQTSGVVSDKEFGCGGRSSRGNLTLLEKAIHSNLDLAVVYQYHNQKCLYTRTQGVARKRRGQTHRQLG